MNTLFETLPRRKRATVYTLVASVVLHGSILGVATLWPARPVPAERPPTEIGGWPVDLPNPPAPEPPALALAMPESVPVPVVDEAMPTEETPPTLEEPMMTEPEPPKPRLKVRTTGRIVSSNPAPATRAAVGNPGTRNPAGVPGGGRGGSMAARWNVSSIPAYPIAQRRDHVEGSGTVRILTDAAGRVTSATMVQSTGNSVLDENTCRHARSVWTGPANASIVVPVTYRLQ